MSPERTSIPIERGGGKLEGTKALAELGFPVPKSQYIYYEDLENEKLLTKAFTALTSPLIVRGSHPNDWHGYIDVLPTAYGVTSLEELKEAINDIKTVAASSDLKKHAKDWKQPFSTEVHVLLQEESASSIGGSILRHPHVLDEIYINYVNRRLRRKSKFLASFSSAIHNSDGVMMGSVNKLRVPKKEVAQAFSFYEQVEQSSLLDPNWTYQMEIGLQPFMIYQLRPFKPRLSVANFEIPSIKSKKLPNIKSDFVFGITPKEGVSLAFMDYGYESLGSDRSLVLPKNPYGLILTSRGDRSLPTRLSLGGLTVIASRTATFDFLEHGEYRLLKRSQYGLVSYRTDNIPIGKYGSQDFDMFQEGRLWSNGDRALVVPEKFADKL